jgi:V/A-type H+-transporting ATPase subunit I
MVLAVLVPLLFGYMFGDVGQGLVILAVGWALRRRSAIGPLLIAAGASATAFGFLFGSVFSLEHVIPALWLHPMDAPVLVLTVPLVAAVLLLTMGQALDGLAAAWAGHLREWWLTHAGFLLFYAAIAMSVAVPEALPAALAGLAWYLAGRLYLDHSALGAARALGELVEDGMRLAVNTISFARVGAFALAHAGLSSAFVTLSETAPGLAGQVAVLVLGNLVIIALETLVVGVQTTRLVLFEFFVRFLRGEGRGFHPLSPPPPIAQGEIHEVVR